MSGTELLLVAVLLVAAAASLTIVGRGTADSGAGDESPGAAARDGRARAVAVLPFADLSPRGDQRYLSDGIAEELISALSGVEGLRVASRTSSFSFQDGDVDVQTIGARLGVGHVVEGSVRKSIDRLRVEARLVNVEDGFRVWSGRFETGAEDIFAIQDSIAVAVARALEIRLAGGAAELRPRGQTADHRAQDLYLRGRFWWNRRSREDLERAVELFREAVARDPGYARALVGLADAYAVLGFYDHRSPELAFPLAREAARRALAIDSTLADAHATLGYAALYYDWDWDAAESHFRRSIELDPGYPVAHQWYANHLTAMGRFEEAAAEMRTASELDPLSSIAAAALGWVHLQADRPEAAMAQLEGVMERDPSFHLSYLWSGQAHEAAGRLAEAEALIRRAVDLSRGSVGARASLARVLALQGRSDDARDLLAELQRGGATDYVPSYEIARVYAGLAAPDSALAWLERAHRERSHSLAFLAVDPQLATLRDRPAYRRLVARMGL